MEWLRNFWRRHVLAPIPEEMTRCGVCNKARCDEGHFNVCPHRLKALDSRPSDNSAA